jgi:murein DD-endopeptidase MepM/ murein hydrolase activator NlpD
MGTTYTVKPNDTLSGIAAANGTTWQALARINGIDNPNLIHPGQVIKFSNASPTSTSGGSTGSSNTGNTYTPFTYDPFKPSDTTNGYGTQAGEWEKTVAGWGDYTWDRQTEYDNLFKDYQNRPDFSYDFNTDALYQQYKDKYIQQGKMAMQDTIGQASAMTGGYGNSYATTAGSQAYQAHLQNLNDIIPELYQLAYDRYNQKGQDMLNQLGLLNNERTFDYGVWSDDYNRAVGNRDYYGTRYDNSLGRDWTIYDSNRDLAHSEHTTAEGYEYQAGRDAVEDDHWNKSYNLSERELELAEDTVKKNNTVDDSGDDDFVGPPKAPEKDYTIIPNPGDNKVEGSGSGKSWTTNNQAKVEENQKQYGGSYYATVEKDLKTMKSNGRTYSEATAYIKELLDSSLITKSEYMTLMQKVRNTWK